MSHYIMLIKLGDGGTAKAEKIPDVMARVVEAWNIIGSGASVYATMGEYDLVAQGDADDAVDVAWLGAQLAGSGISTCTMQAFGEAELRERFDAPPLERRFPVLW